ncbi:MAG: SDR family NAD(P)-dependent oxidoreductase [Bacteroidota bacterium]
MDLNKIALITGGSSGIGLTISKKFAAAGYQLRWVSLFANELLQAKGEVQEEFPNCHIVTLTLDLTRSDAAQNVLNWTQKNNWKIDVLVNNAGVGTFGFLEETNFRRELDMINLNLVNVYKMTRLFLQEMLQRNEGTIINISSNSSFQPIPKLNTYASTKAFITHFTRGLTEELKIKKSKVRVMCICPAAISNTNFKTTNQMSHIKTFNGLVTTTAEEVAKDVWNGFTKGKDFVISGWKMRMLYRLINFVPYSVQQYLVRQEIQEN